MVSGLRASAGPGADVRLWHPGMSDEDVQVRTSTQHLTHDCSRSW